MSGRIRTVKPEWLEDERMASSSDATRVLSIAIILVADDYGRGRASVAHLASAAWAYELERNDGDDAPEVLRKCSGALRDLAAMGFVTLYTVDGQRYFEIRNWEKHQKVSHKGMPRVPAPPSPSTPVVPPTSTPSGESPESRQSVSGKAPASLVPDLRSGSPITDPDPEGIARAPAAPPAGTEAIELSTERIRSAFAAAFQTAARAVGSTAPPWLNGLTNSREWGELRAWLVDAFPGAEVATASALGAGFAKHAFARKRGYPFRGGNGALMHGPGEFLENGHAQPSSFQHVKRSALERLPEDVR